jgi:hypothetical protein
MEITSIKGEEQDEIEKILLPIHGNEAANEGGLDEYISKLVEFSKNELERKKVDIESQIANASLKAAMFISFLPAFIIVTLELFSTPAQIKAMLPFVAVFSFFPSFCILFKDGWKRNNRLYALKMALIGK